MSVIKKKNTFLYYFCFRLAKVGKDTYEVIFHQAALKEKQKMINEKKRFWQKHQKFFLMQVPLIRKMNVEL